MKRVRHVDFMIFPNCIWMINNDNMLSSLNFLFGHDIQVSDKIIFLDFDGVLAIDNPGLSDAHERDKYGTIFSHHCVDCLRQIIDDTSARIVITSSWTNYLSLRKIKRMWRYRNLPGMVVDTIRNDGMDRSIKIDNWLIRYNITNYVIIDDMDSRQFDEHLQGRLITVNTRFGLSLIEVNEVCKLLNVQ